MFSLHSRDGGRQVSSGINLSHHQIGLPEAHPIDIALQSFLLMAMCPTSETSGRSGAAVLQLPGLTLMPGNDAAVAGP